ncbi:MAG: alanyl-tRNA editing protein [Anaerolineae bacterium]|nr:alanyl-tRNA editing protein [Anaerolineae bacterium]
MTDKIFWQDPYLTTLDTHLTGVDGNEVTLAATILYAFSGGQESDAGSIGGCTVQAARCEGHEIIYTLPVDHALKPGEPVRLRLDWPRRYALMRLHFAAELVLELVTRTLPGITRIGAHIAADKARIDFVWPTHLTPILAPVLAGAHALIAADHPIYSGFTDRAAGRRCWQIEGFARVDCGGTHLRRTGEIGPLALKRRNIGSGKERVEIYLAPSTGTTGQPHATL